MKKTIISPLITNITSESINLYFNDIKKFPLLTREEEIKYLKMRDINKDYAVNKLIEGNLRLVVTIAKFYQYSKLPLEDLIQIGNIGLYKAIIAYNDPTYSIKLSDYVSYKIRGEILNALTTELKGIHLPRYISELVIKVSKFINDYNQKFGYEPDLETISEELNIDSDTLQSINNILNFNMCSETNITDEDGNTIFESIGTEDNIYFPNQVFREKIKVILNEQEYNYIIDSFGFNGIELNSEEIADKYGVTIDRVRFVLNTAIKKLRKYPELQNLI